MSSARTVVRGLLRAWIQQDCRSPRYYTRRTQHHILVHGTFVDVAAAAVAAGVVLAAAGDVDFVKLVFVFGCVVHMTLGTLKYYMGLAEMNSEETFEHLAFVENLTGVRFHILKRFQNYFYSIPLCFLCPC